MKLAKKLFVGILAVALFVSCLALSASAEAPEISIDNIEKVLEYRLCDTYLAEDFEGDAGAYTFNSAYTNDADVPYFSLVSNEKSKFEITSDGDNGVLLVTNDSSVDGVGYKFYFEDGSCMFPKIAMSFDFKTGDADAENGADVIVKATLRDYFEPVVLFSANTSNDSDPYFTYSEYIADRILYSEKRAEGVAPELNTWYHVDLTLDLEGATYTVSVTSGDETVLDVAYDVIESVGIDSLRLYVQDAENAGVTKTYFDDVTAYEGTYKRDVLDPENALAAQIIAFDAYASDSKTSIEDRLAIADLYAKLFEGEDGGIRYTPPKDIKEYAKVKAITDNAKSFRNKIYADAFIEYTANISKQPTYYDKIEYRDTYAKEFYDMFPSTLSALRSIYGMTDIYDGSETYADAVLAAKAAYDGISSEISAIAAYSEGFVKEIEENYNARNTDYTYMTAKANKLAILITKADPAYVYSDINPDTKYPTVADAIAVYDALKVKISEIDANVATFIPAVTAMKIVEADSVSAASPYLTSNFDELYANYLTANTVFAQGTVHPALDPATYPGLSAFIEKYYTYAEYVEERLAETNLFISIVNGANASAYYVTITQQLKDAALYLDNNKEKSLEKIDGVEDAIALYSTVQKKLADTIKSAENYIAAVNAIDIKASYSTLKKAVDKALGLKSSGSVTGIEGVKEANIKLAEAEAKVAALEGYSSTLIAAVEALEDAVTLKERRQLIFTALSAKDSAEDSISGVSDAKTALSAYVEAYNADVAAANAFFASAVSNAAATVSACAPSTALVNVTSVVSALVK